MGRHFAGSEQKGDRSGDVVARYPALQHRWLYLLDGPLKWLLGDRYGLHRPSR